MRAPVSKTRLKPSERLMQDAFEYFREAIQRSLGSASGADLAKFLNETVARKLVFTTIYASDDLRAYKVFETLNARGVKLSSTLYIALTRPDDPMWNKKQRASVAELDLFNVSQCYPLLFATRRVLDDAQLARLLRVCAIISLRYNVISSLTPNEMERVYSRVAIRVWRHELTTCATILPELRSLYIPDDKFKSTFAFRTINTNGNRWKRLAPMPFGNSG